MEQLLPPINTAMIVFSGIALVVGRVFIARGDVRAHRAAMLTATGFAGLFLITYVTRWALFGSTSFTGTGWLRTAYFSLLIGHSILAVLVVPFVVMALRHALGGRFANHRRWARIAFPMWLVVAVSGWGVYWMLHHL